MTDHLPEIRALLADITPAPWELVGIEGKTAWQVLGRTSNGDAPLVGAFRTAYDARLCARAPELLRWAVGRIGDLESLVLELGERGG